jgi:hypothetical protein
MMILKVTAGAGHFPVSWPLRAGLDTCIASSDVSQNVNICTSVSPFKIDTLPTTHCGLSA